MKQPGLNPVCKFDHPRLPGAAFPLQPWFGPGLLLSAALGSRAGGSFKVIENVFLHRWIVLNVFGLAGLH